MATEFFLTLDEAQKYYLTFTSLCCHWCTETFENIAFGMPLRYDHSQTKPTFWTKGIYCSLWCLQDAFKHDRKLDLNQRTQTKYLIKKMFQMCGKPELPERPLPSEVLKKFGGGIDIKQYRDETNCIRYTPLPFRLCPIKQYYEYTHAESAVRRRIAANFDIEENFDNLNLE